MIPWLVCNSGAKQNKRFINNGRKCAVIIGLDSLNLNLITDAWIPVRRKDGERVIIAPWQMTDSYLAFPDWPRADLNIACIELLIGLVFLADPPRDEEDWQKRQAPDPARLRERLAPFAPAFNLLGDGPRFMQDLEPFEGKADDANAPDMLFIDSAGGQTARNNADLMVKRDRYPRIDLPLAAMALFTLQAHAPSGGAGNRTSMRGGGPMVTLVEPGGGLWPLIWANVPDGQAAETQDLPWMRTARTSEKGQFVFPHEAHPAQALFGTPRRLRLIADGEGAIGVAQKPYGANYSGWVHPLTPYYRVKPGAELLPRHPRAGAFGYRNWLGIVAGRPSGHDDTANRASVVDLWQARDGGRVDILVAGWAMDNMKPRDFVFSRAPLITLDDTAAQRMEALVKAADKFAVALRGALTVLLAEGEARETAREDFYIRTQPQFEARLDALISASHDWPLIATAWVGDLRAVAIAMFDAAAEPGLADRDIKLQRKIIEAHGALSGAFAGYGKLGREAYDALDLPVPEQGGKKKKGKAA